MEVKMIAYQFSDDLEVICELLGITDKELASQIRVSQDTVTRWKNGRNDVSPDHMSRVYDFAFAEGIRLNKIREQLYKEDCKDKNRMILFHGAKNNIEGKIFKCIKPAGQQKTDMASTHSYK